MMRPQPAAARRRWYSMMFAVTKPSDVAWLDHIGGITMRLRRVRPGRDNGESKSGMMPHGGGCGWERRSRLSADSPVSYTHLRAHETDSYLVCRLLLEKK